MIVVQWSDEEDQQPWTVPRELLPVTPKVQGNDVPTLITDFFDWLETAWQLPLFQSETARPPLPLPLTLSEEQYTIPDLARLCGCTFDWLYRYVERFQIASPGYVPYLSPTGTKGQCRAYRKEDLVLFLEQWEWKRLTQMLDQWWLRFFPPACGTWQRCRLVAGASDRYLEQNDLLRIRNPGDLSAGSSVGASLPQRTVSA